MKSLLGSTWTNLPINHVISSNRKNITVIPLLTGRRERRELYGEDLRHKREKKNPMGGKHSGTDITVNICVLYPHPESDQLLPGEKSSLAGGPQPSMMGFGGSCGTGCWRRASRKTHSV